jgi:hypothetical protein
MKKPVQIGKVSFSPVWSNYDYPTFLKQYKKFEERAKVKPDQAANLLGIEVPKKESSK